MTATADSVMDALQEMLHMAQQPHSDCDWASDTECRAERYGDGNSDEHERLRRAEQVIKATPEVTP
tara:strand:+ start:67 stop:264 length:198 start_codon:yes stop_codon:yes gene_type:complete